MTPTLQVAEKVRRLTYLNEVSSTRKVLHSYQLVVAVGSIVQILTFLPECDPGQVT